MARGLRRLKLPDSEVDPNKKRLLLLEQILRHWQLWRAMYEDEGLESITIQGEEWHFLDLLRGIETLPIRQRQALWLILIEDMKNIDVAKIMLPNSQYIDGEVVAQYKNTALVKLLAFHDGGGSGVDRQNTGNSKPTVSLREANGTQIGSVPGTRVGSRQTLSTRS